MWVLLLLSTVLYYNQEWKIRNVCISKYIEDI